MLKFTSHGKHQHRHILKQDAFQRAVCAIAQRCFPGQGNLNASLSELAKAVLTPLTEALDFHTHVDVSSYAVVRCDKSD